MNTRSTGAETPALAGDMQNVVYTKTLTCGVIMLRKFGITLAVSVMCLFAATAFAEVKTFPKFKVDVPAGWAASQDGETVILVANDKSASVSITVASLQGMTLKDLAAAMSQQLKGSPPQAVDGGGYHFTFKSGAVESNAIVSGDDTTYVLFVATGDSPQIDHIMNSLEDR